MKASAFDQCPSGEVRARVLVFGGLVQADVDAGYRLADFVEAQQIDFRILIDRHAGEVFDDLSRRPAGHGQAIPADLHLVDTLIAQFAGRGELRETERTVDLGPAEVVKQVDIGIARHRERPDVMKERGPAPVAGRSGCEGR
jgi:hypothetical protein